MPGKDRCIGGIKTGKPGERFQFGKLIGESRLGHHRPPEILNRAKPPRDHASSSDDDMPLHHAGSVVDGRFHGKHSLLRIRVCLVERQKTR